MAENHGALTVEVVAADRFVWSGEVSLVKAKTADGDIGVMAGHTPVLAILAPGEVVLTPAQGGGAISVEVSGGFFSVDRNRVVIAADDATVNSGLSKTEAGK